MTDKLLSIAAGVLLGIGALVIEQAIFPSVDGLVPGVAFVIGAYAISTQTDDSLSFVTAGTTGYYFSDIYETLIRIYHGNPNV